MYDVIALTPVRVRPPRYSASWPASKGAASPKPRNPNTRTAMPALLLIENGRLCERVDKEAWCVIRITR